MDEQRKPLNEVLSMIRTMLNSKKNSKKGVTFADMSEAIIIGNDKYLRLLKKSPEKVGQFGGRINNYIYDLRVPEQDFGSVRERAENFVRAIYDFRKWTLRDFCLNEKKYNLYKVSCKLLVDGFTERENVDVDQMKSIQNYIKSHNENIEQQIQKFKELQNSNGKPMESYNKNEKRSELHMKAVAFDNNENKVGFQLVSFRDLLFDLFDISNTTSIYEFEAVEENPDFDRLLIVGKQETFSLKGDGIERIVKMVESPVESKVYLIQTGSDIEYEIEGFDSMEDAVSALLVQINSDSGIFLDYLDRTYEVPVHSLDGTEEHSKFHFDTVTTFSKKVQYLLS